MGIGRLKTPYSGLCLPCNWFKFGPCPDLMRVSTNKGISGCINLAISWLGYGIADGKNNCGITNPYLSFTVGATGAFEVMIDFWKAYKDGAWASSTVATIYATQNNNTGRTLTAYIIGAGSGSGSTKAYTPEVSATCQCPTVSKGTLTVFDDGTYALA